MSARTGAAIVGAAETTELGKIPDVSELTLHLDAARNAIADAGIDKAEIDGIAGVGRYPGMVAQQLGLHPGYVDGTSVGGCSFLIHVRHATAAIANGLASMVLITHGESGRSRVGVAGFPGPGGPAFQFQFPYGVTGAPTMFPIGVVRYMKELGLTHEQLASVAVVQRQWAAMNPRAMMREPITVDDVLASPLVAYPMHRLECCLVTDGGGALLVTSAERARDMDLPHPPVLHRGDGRGVGARDDLADGRLHDVGGVPIVRADRVRERGHRTCRRRPPHGVRRVRAPPDLRARGSRLRRSRRSGSVHRGGEHRTRWIAPDEHERRRALLHAHRDVRHVRRSRSRCGRCAAPRPPRSPTSR